MESEDAWLEQFFSERNEICRDHPEQLEFYILCQDKCVNLNVKVDLSNAGTVSLINLI